MIHDFCHIKLITSFGILNWPLLMLKYLMKFWYLKEPSWRWDEPSEVANHVQWFCLSRKNTPVKIWLWIQGICETVSGVLLKEERLTHWLNWAIFKRSDRLMKNHLKWAFQWVNTVIQQQVPTFSCWHWECCWKSTIHLEYQIQAPTSY